MVRELLPSKKRSFYAMLKSTSKMKTPSHRISRQCINNWKSATDFLIITNINKEKMQGQLRYFDLFSSHSF